MKKLAAALVAALLLAVPARAAAAPPSVDAGAAVLVEQCFVTNAADVEAFGTEEGCQKAAEAYYRAILRYLGLDAPENT